MLGIINKRDVPALSVRAEVGSVDAEKRTAEMVFSTATPVLRSSFWDGDFFEELSMDPAHVRMGRLQSGTAPLLSDHRAGTSSTIGVIESARLEGNKGVATVRFAKAGIDPEADKIFAKVQDGILRNVSVGYRIYKFEEQGGTKKGETPTFRATDWEPHEISVVAIGADDQAGFRSSDAQTKRSCEFITTRGSPQKEQSVNEEEKKAAELAARAAELKEATERAIRIERERTAGIQSAVRAVKLPEEFAEKLIADGTDLSKAREVVLNEAARRSDATPTDNHIPIEVGDTDGEKFARGVVSAQLERFGVLDVVRQAAVKDAKRGTLFPQLAGTEASGGDFRGMRMSELARRCLERGGVDTRGMSDSRAVEKALIFRSSSPGMATTSDFTVLLESVLYKSLLGQYAIQSDTWREFCKVDTTQDFRPSNRYRTGSFGNIPVVPEHAEFKSMPIPDGLKQSISTETKGAMLAVSRQALVNDDMGAIIATIGGFARAAGLTLENEVYALLTANGGLGATFGAQTFFHATNANINATGSALGVTGIDADRVQMSQQKDISANEYLGLRPKVLLVPVGLGGQARITNTSVYDPEVSNKFQVPNKVVGLFAQTVDTPRLSGTRRYLFADPAECAAIVVAFLNGEQAPFLERREGWRVDGSEMKLRFDAKAQFFDPKGAVTNAGV